MNELQALAAEIEEVAATLAAVRWMDERLRRALAEIAALRREP